MQSRDVYVLKELWPLTLLKDNSGQFENAYLFDKKSRSERKSPNFGDCKVIKNIYSSDANNWH